MAFDRALGGDYAPAVAQAPESPQDITSLLHRWRGGDRDALERLTPLVYDELRRMAARYLSHERSDHTLQRTALVHEAFVRLVDQRRVEWQSRAHFYGLAAQLMRRILVDHARRTGRVKRGADVARVSLDVAPEVPGADTIDPADAVALDEALTKLETMDPMQGRVVELRFFGGLTVEEAAEALGVSPTTVKREWAVAKAWLYREITGVA